MPAAPPPARRCRLGTAGPGAPTASLLGEGFLVGVATSGYQIEGGFNGDGEPHNNWSGWEATGRVERSGLACDFWRHPDRGARPGRRHRLQRLPALGGVGPPRAPPRSTSTTPRWSATPRSSSLCAARGLEPMVTLHHFTHPWWLGEEFWLRPGSPDVFARHVARIVPALAPYCRRWVTINEPNIVMLMGWIEGACPPGRRMAVSDAFCVLDNLLDRARAGGRRRHRGASPRRR